MSVYACADMHGNGSIWRQIKDFLKPDDILYFLGDAADRGPDGVEIIKDLLTMRAIYIKGNHEDLLVKGMAEITAVPPIYGKCFDLWMWNGGKPTYEALMKDPDAVEIINALNNLISYTCYQNKSGQIIHLSHAGFTIGNKPKDEEKLMWDRTHYIDNPTGTNEIIVHGHTPIPYLIEDLEELKMFFHGEDWWNDIIQKNNVLIYSNGEKIDIDCGAVFTGKSALINLDTFDIIPFEGEIMI